jgi:hypothetical protein
VTFKLNEKRLYTLREAASYIARSVPSMRALIYAGEFEVVRVGPRGKQFIAKEELEAFIRRNSTRHAPPAKAHLQR